MKNTDNSPSPASRAQSGAQFLSYLKSFQRQWGGNENALAEFQAGNPFFLKIRVRHPLLDKIIEHLCSQNEPIILTGHAGDGKTTLAFSAYKELTGNEVSRQLAKNNVLNFQFATQNGTQNGLLIKDLSEQKRNTYSQILQELIKPSRHSILVSNTGALLNFFLDQTPSTRKDEVESSLLQELKKLESSFEFEGHKFRIINLAQYNSLPLAQDIFDKILDDQCWPECTGCNLRQRNLCPVALNRALLTENNGLARRRIFLIYERLHAYGVRLTLRQLTEHLAYSLTGGLGPSELCNDPQFAFPSQYYCFNLFFGGYDITPDPAITRMPAIQALSEQGIGSHTLPCVDKQIWHLECRNLDFTLFPTIESIFSKLREIGSRDIDRYKAALARRQIRRILYFFTDEEESTATSLTKHNICEQIQIEFLQSPGTILHKKLKLFQNDNTIKLNQAQKKELLPLLFYVLQEHFTGLRLPERDDSSQNKRLYITLNRSSAQIRQTVQIVLTSLDWKDNFDLSIQRDTADNGTQLINLAGKGGMKALAPMPLTIPYWDYIYRRHEGELGMIPRSTFNQRLENLKSNILQISRQEMDEDDSTLKLLCCCADLNLVEKEFILSKDNDNITTIEVNYA